jgi:hypothetical protein
MSCEPFSNDVAWQGQGNQLAARTKRPALGLLSERIGRQDQGQLVKIIEQGGSCGFSAHQRVDRLSRLPDFQHAWFVRIKRIAQLSANA